MSTNVLLTSTYYLFTPLVYAGDEEMNVQWKAFQSGKYICNTYVPDNPDSGSDQTVSCAGNFMEKRNSLLEKRGVVGRVTWATDPTGYAVNALVFTKFW